MTNLDELRLEISGEGLTGEQVQERIESYVNQRTMQVAQETEARILEQARKTRDEDILKARGNRMLTSEEKAFYKNLDEYVRTGFVQGVADVPMPYTIIERVMEDLTTNHPLLQCVEFVTAPARVDMVYNADGIKLAKWGKITDAVTKELSTGFKTMSLSAGKLSAFLPISLGVLDLGPVWLDNYIRTVMGEAIAEGLEDGIINGTGVDMPIGMTKDIDGTFNTTTGYPGKNNVTVTALDPATYATILGTLAVHLCDEDYGTPRSRAVNEVLMIVNPTTYLTKVYPAIAMKNVNGTYVESFPFPTRVVQSNAVPANTAVFGLDKKYFFGLCSDQGGKLDYSDHLKFLDDQRVYKIKLYGNGTPKDNNAFVVADITNLAPVYPTVNAVNSGDVAVSGEITTKAGAGA